MLKQNFIAQCIQTISKIVAHILIITIWLVRPMLGPMNICPYTIGCTQYAIQQLQKKSLLTALNNICSRLIQCHPFGNRRIE